MISLIWAMDKNRTIGRDNLLPWRIPADLAYYKKTTMGHTVVMGRKTFESIGRPLPGRKNVIITTSREFFQEGCIICHSIQGALAYCQEGEVFIIGGSAIYSEFLPYADRLYITLIDGIFEGDTFFPEIDPGLWNLISETKGPKDEKNPYDYWWQVFEKNQP